MTFEEYVGSRGPALVRLARLLTGDEHRAEDLTQDVLARAYVHWRRIARADRPDVYVRRMLVNANNSWWRRRSSRELAVDTFADRPQRGDLGGEAADRDEMWRLIRRPARPPAGGAGAALLRGPRRRRRSPRSSTARRSPSAPTRCGRSPTSGSAAASRRRTGAGRDRPRPADRLGPCGSGPRARWTPTGCCGRRVPGAAAANCRRRAAAGHRAGPGRWCSASSAWPARTSPGCPAACPGPRPRRPSPRRCRPRADGVPGRRRATRRWSAPIRRCCTSASTRPRPATCGWAAGAGRGDRSGWASAAGSRSSSSWSRRADAREPALTRVPSTARRQDAASDRPRPSTARPARSGGTAGRSGRAALAARPRPVRPGAPCSAGTVTVLDRAVEALRLERGAPVRRAAAARPPCRRARRVSALLGRRRRLPEAGHRRVRPRDRDAEARCRVRLPVRDADRRAAAPTATGRSVAGPRYLYPDGAETGAARHPERRA